MIGFVFSKEDPASINVLNNLKKKFEFKILDQKEYDLYIIKTLNVLAFVIEEDIVDARSLEGVNIPATRLIFVSRHKSESKLPAFLVHFPGLWNKKSRPRLSIADACMAKKLITLLYKIDKQPPYNEWLINLEATHHGPIDVKVPISFIEIGSGPEEWEDETAGKILMQVLVKAVKEESQCESIVGYGGPHYAPQFTKIAINTNFGVGHIMPKYAFNQSSDDAILEAVERTYPRPTMAVIDWKGLNSSQRKRVLSILGNKVIIKKAKEII